MKTSELAKQLKPYIIKWINDAGGGGGATSGGGTGGNFAPTPHALNSYHHGGQLPHNSTWMSGLDSDTHVQYAAADGLGTRAAYIAERLNKSIFSGSGITGGGLLTSNQTLTLRTPGVNLAASSTNVVNASGHTHAVNAKSDVSATTTEDLLKSTASGGLTLKTLDVMGTVDILGGDLTVGSGMTLFVDESGNNVGIAGAPDPQFALDVNGPFHADAIYGPIGRLLKDCVFLAHFDGPLDTNDYSGTPQTVQGELPTTSSAIVYRPAKYNKGLQSAYATVNKINNPVFDNASDWDNGWTTSASVIVTQNTNPTWVYSGSNSARLNVTGSVSRTYTTTVNVGNTNAHYLSVYVKKQDGSIVSSSDVALFYGGGITPDDFVHMGNGWYLVGASVAGVSANTATGLYPLPVGEYYYVGGVQIEEYAYPTPLAHGDMIVGHSWASTPHGSWTTRNVSRLLYSSQLDWVSSDFSIGFWIQPWLDQSENTTTNWAFCWAYDAANYIGMIYSTSGIVLRWEAADAIQTIGTVTGITRGTWYHVAFVLEGTTLTGYVDGEAVGSITIGSMEGVPSTLAVGSYYTGANPFTGMIDDFYVVKRAQTADEIGAIVDSEVPVAAETGATSWFSGGVAPIWVDSDGLWMRDHTGLEVMGWSAVDNKSWGGVTLDMGDNLVGRYGSGSGGWMRWDRSAGQLKLGYSNACSLAFDGSGACIVGKLQMPGASAAIAIGSTPPTASNAGTGIWIDQNGLTGLAANTYQVKISSANGYIEAASGSATISSSGIIVNGQGKITIRGGQAGGYPRMSLDYMEDSNAAQIVYSEDSSGSDSAISFGGQDISYFTTGAGKHYFSTGRVQVTRGIDLTTQPTPTAASVSILVEGDYQKYSGGNTYSGYLFVPLATRLSSSSWDGDARSSSPKTLLDLSAVFGAPASIKAVLVQLAIRDSNSAGTDCAVILSPNNSTTQDQIISCHGLANDTWARGQLTVPCNSNGDIYYQFYASGVATLDVHMYITGYWI